MTIDRATEVMTKCFSKSYGVEVHAALGVLDLDTISKTEAYIFLMENLNIRRCSLVAQIMNANVSY